MLKRALAGCMTTTLVYHAAVRGIRIERLESRLEGDLDLQGLFGLSDEVRPGFKNIRAHFRVKANATAAELKELFKYSVVCDGPSLKSATGPRVLGLFASADMPDAFTADREINRMGRAPSLREMTARALDILSKRYGGHNLLVI